MSPACFSAIIVVLCLTINFTTGVDWNERYNVDPRRSALVWTTGQNISLVVCPPENQGTTAAPGARSARADYNVPVDVFVPDSDKDVEAVRDLRRREERVKAVLESAMGDTRIVSQDKARLLGELMGEVVTKCIRDAGATSATRNITLPPSFINGLVLPLGGAVARIFLERPPPAENMYERHLDFDLGGNTFFKINSMQNNTVARIIFSQVHWETFARYAVKVLGNTMSREEYLDAVGFSTGLTMSLMQQVNGTVIRQDVVTTARKFVGNFLKAYLLMNNQYFSFMDHSIGWLADDIALYTADDILRVRVPAGTPATRGEWDKYAKAASQGLRNLRLISIGLLMSYRNGPMSLQFQPPEVLGSMVPPAWMAMRYQFPAV